MSWRTPRPGLLALLGLLQSRADWSGAELADRLRVTDRTVRNDIDRLRGSATRSTPSAVRAVATGSASAPSCRRCCSTTTRRSRSPSACAPDRDQRHRGDQRPGAGQARARAAPPAPRRVNAVRDAVSAGPENTGSNVDDPRSTRRSSPEVAAAIRDHEELRFDYRRHEASGSRSSRTGWSAGSGAGIVVARDAADATAGRRTGWTGCGCARPAAAGSRRSRCPARLPVFVLREVAFAGWSVHARIAVDAPAEEVLARINPDRRRRREP